LSKAFVGDTARLQWTGMDSGEKAGRGNLFWEHMGRIEIRVLIGN
jgi:hypothetical protein